MAIQDMLHQRQMSSLHASPGYSEVQFTGQRTKCIMIMEGDA